MPLATEFVCSAMSLADCPRWDRVEVAFAGRSNVGKSSMLNALTETKGLARISKTPGRTRAINYFTMGSDIALVDLPGFGYARMSQNEASRLSRLINDFLQKRSELAALVLLIDARRGPEAQELALAGILEQRVELIVAATKCDKLNQSERAASLARFERVSLHPLMCSAQTGDGIAVLRRRILTLARYAGSAGRHEA